MMDKLISQQAAIDAIKEYFARIGKLKRRGLAKGEKAISLDMVGTIKTLPSAQIEPEAVSEWKKEFREYVDSLDIARDDWKGIIEYIDELPSVQPETNCSEIPNNWIPCSERLPEDEYVLISKKPSKISGDKWCVAIAIRTADPRSRKIQWRDSGFGVIQDDKVLAWLPLPEPYQEGGEQDDTD